MFRPRNEPRLSQPIVTEWVGCLVAALAMWATPLWAEPREDLAAAVRRLGASHSFAERHDAGDLLIRSGADAIPYLREAASSPSPEVRYRAQLLLEEIEHQLLDLQASHFSREKTSRTNSRPGNDMRRWRARATPSGGCSSRC